MKKLLLLILTLTLIACDAQTKEFIGSSWRVTSLEMEGKAIAVANEVILTVKSDSEFALALDKNNCFGTYVITNTNEIQLKTLGCTELCCDSEFSSEVTQALYKVSSIKMKKDVVTLEGKDVSITFKKHLEAKNRIQMMHKDKPIVEKKEKIPSEETTNIGKIENPNQQIEKEKIQGTGEFIVLYKSPCKGNCEEYTMTFYENGVVLYEGKFNAKIQGVRTLQLAKESIATMFTSFQTENYHGFNEVYDDNRIMDLQNTYLTYQGKKIQIRFKPNAPQKLQELLMIVEKEAEQVLQQLKK